MKPPKKIKIGSRTFSLKFTNPGDDSQLEGNYGYTRVNYDQIVIDKDRSDDAIRVTVLHEIMHAIRLVHANRYEDEVYKPVKNLSPDDAEHYYIDLWSEGLVSLLQNNPELNKYLMKEGK